MEGIAGAKTEGGTGGGVVVCTGVGVVGKGGGVGTTTGSAGSGVGIAIVAAAIISSRSSSRLSSERILALGRGGGTIAAGTEDSGLDVGSSISSAWIAVASAIEGVAKDIKTSSFVFSSAV